MQDSSSTNSQSVPAHEDRIDTSFAHLMSPIADLGKTQILQQNFHVDTGTSGSVRIKEPKSVKVHPPPLAVRKQNSEMQSTRQTASAGFFKAFQNNAKAQALNKQMLVSQINRNIFGGNGSSRGSNTIEPPDLLISSKDSKVEVKRDNLNGKQQTQTSEPSSNAQRRQQRSLIASRRNSKEQTSYPIVPQRGDDQFHESQLVCSPVVIDESKPSTYFKPLTREISSRGRILSQPSSQISQATNAESINCPSSKSSSRRVIGVHGLLPSIDQANYLPQIVQSQQVSSRVIREQFSADEDFRSYQSVKISKNLSKPPIQRLTQGNNHSMIISAPISPPSEVLNNSLLDQSHIAPHSQINQSLEESMTLQKPFGGKLHQNYPPAYLTVNRKRPIQYPMSVGYKEPQKIFQSERRKPQPTDSMQQWKHQTMIPSTVISQIKANNDSLLFNGENDLSANYHTIDDTIPNASGSGLYALKKVGVGFETQGRAVSIDRSQRVKKDTSMGDFSSLSLVSKPSHHNVRQKPNNNLSTAQSMTATHQQRPSFVFSPERPSPNVESLSNYQSLASLAFKKQSQKEQDGDHMHETGTFPNFQNMQNQQTFGQQVHLAPQINFQNLVLSPQQQKELFFSPQMMGQISHQRQLSFNEDVLKDLPSYQGASHQQSPTNQNPGQMMQPMIYLPPPVTALPIYNNQDLGVSQEEQDSLILSHKRSNSQGSYDYQLKKRPQQKQRGLAQKIVLPKNSSFLTKSGLTPTIGSQAFDQISQTSVNAAAAVLANLNQRKLNSGFTNGVPLKDMTESHINVIQSPQVINNQQPQCIINFNISFGCFPKQEQYKQYKNQNESCFSPQRHPGEESIQHNISEAKPPLPDWLKPLGNSELPNTSELLLGKKQASTSSNENAKPSSMTLSTDHLTKTRHSGPDSSSGGNFPNSPFSPAEESTASKYQSKLIQEVKSTSQQELEEMRRNIKTPCFNSGAGSNGHANFTHHNPSTDVKHPSIYL